MGVHPSAIGYIGIGTDPDYVPVPYAAHLDIYVAGEDNSRQVLLTASQKLSGIDRLPGDEADFPFTLLSFVHTREAMDTADSFTLTLFDPYWVVIEKALLGVGNSLAFSYYMVGYAPGAGSVRMNVSPTFRACILSWQSDVTETGTILTLLGTGFLVGRHIEKNVSWGGKDMLISEIVETIALGTHDTEDTKKALKKPWRIVDKKGVSTITKTKAVQAGSGSQTPSKEYLGLSAAKELGEKILLGRGAVANENRRFHQTEQTDLAFIRGLIPYAETEEGRHDYAVYLDPKVELGYPPDHPNSHPTLHFHPKLWAPGESGSNFVPEPLRTFTYLYGYPDSEVIRFSPNVEVNAMSGGPGGEAGASYWDVVTSAAGFVVASWKSEINKLGAQATELVAKQQAAVNETMKQIGLSQTKVHLTPAEAVNAVFNYWYTGASMGTVAELVIVGDPSLDPGFSVRVLVMLPQIGPAKLEQGALHPASGDFFVSRVTNSIEGGTFTTTAELLKAGIVTTVLGGDDSPFKQIRELHAEGVSEKVKFSNGAKGAKIPYEAGKGPFAGAVASARAGDRLAPPVCGTMPATGEFHNDRGDHLHQGLDISGNDGEEIRMPIGGQIKEVRSKDEIDPRTGKPRSAGNSITMLGDDGNTYKFFHLKNYDPSKKGRIEPNAVIGKVGTTGRSSGPHLHVEVYDAKGKAMDPAFIFGDLKAC